MNNLNTCDNTADIYVSLRARCGSIEYDRRHYDNGTFTRVERDVFIHHCERFASDVRYHYRVGQLTEAQALRFMSALYGLRVSSSI
jgi:hypothetical protein